MTDMPKTILVAVLTGWDKAVPSDFFTNDDVHFEGNNDSWRLIDKTNCRWVRYHIGPGYLRQPRRWNLKEPDVVFNLISDVELNPKTLRIAERITAPVRERVINDPVHIRRTGREDVAKTMRDIPGLIFPCVIRLSHPTLAQLQALIDAENFAFPAIVQRPAAASTGETLGIFDKPEDLRPILESGAQELVLTEFKDYRSPDGLYRKMRLFVIGNAIVFRHLLFSQNWDVQAKDRLGVMADRPDLQDEERSMMESDGAAVLEPVRQGLVELMKRMKLDYFGMDCAVAPDGGLLIFDVSAAMNFFPLPNDRRYEYLHACYGEAVNTMNSLLYSRARQNAMQTA